MILHGNTTQMWTFTDEGSFHDVTSLNVRVLEKVGLRLERF